jgi:uncharacterized protein
MLPLFPLSQPVYPGVIFKLRIFEQRYLRLVRDSMADSAPFAVVPIREGREVGVTPDIFPWGTLVQITDFERYDDGLLGISIYGDQRIRVAESWTESDGLVMSESEILPPEPREAPGTANQDLIRLLDDLVEGLQMGFLFPEERPTLASLGWRLATLLPFSDTTKMQLLSEDNAGNRLKIIRKELSEMVR